MKNDHGIVYDWERRLLDAKRQNEIQRLDNEINYLKQQIYIRELHLFLKKALYRQ